MPIATICHRTGYQNLSNFNRQFLREFGITPSGYRVRQLQTSASQEGSR